MHNHPSLTTNSTPLRALPPSPPGDETTRQANAAGSMKVETQAEPVALGEDTMGSANFSAAAAAAAGPGLRTQSSALSHSQNSIGGGGRMVSLGSASVGLPHAAPSGAYDMHPHEYNGGQQMMQREMSNEEVRIGKCRPSNLRKFLSD